MSRYYYLKKGIEELFIGPIDQYLDDGYLSEEIANAKSSIKVLAAYSPRNHKDLGRIISELNDCFDWVRDLIGKESVARIINNGLDDGWDLYLDNKLIKKGKGGAANADSN